MCVCVKEKYCFLMGKNVMIINNYDGRGDVTFITVILEAVKF